jgi:hypothetical protein
MPVKPSTPLPPAPIAAPPLPQKRPAKIVLAQEENRCVTMSDWTAFRLGFCFAYGALAATLSLAIIGGLLAILVVLVMGMGIVAAT